MLVPVYDFTGSILIHRSVIEELNGVIRQLGEQKILSMVESKEFRKGIVQLEWVQRKSQMRMEDLHNTAREIQMLKVTRDIQAFLNEEDYERKKSEAAIGGGLRPPLLSLPDISVSGMEEKRARGSRQ